MSMSVLASVISTFESTERKKCQPSIISTSWGGVAGLARRLEARAHAEPARHYLPRLGPAEHPRDGTQALEARTRVGRLDGRDPMFSEPSCSTGVDAMK